MSKEFSIGFFKEKEENKYAARGTCGKIQPAPGRPEEGEDGDKGTIGVCSYKFDDAFTTTYRNNLQKILEDKGCKVSVVDGNNDQNKQNEQIDTFITQGVKALIINPVMPSAADSIIDKVKNADVPTVLHQPWAHRRADVRLR